MNDSHRPLSHLISSSAKLRCSLQNLDRLFQPFLEYLLCFLRCVVDFARPPQLHEVRRPVTRYGEVPAAVLDDTMPQYLQGEPDGRYGDADCKSQDGDKNSNQVTAHCTTLPG